MAVNMIRVGRNNLCWNIPLATYIIDRESINEQNIYLNRKLQFFQINPPPKKRPSKATVFSLFYGSPNLLVLQNLFCYHPFWVGVPLELVLLGRPLGDGAGLVLSLGVVGQVVGTRGHRTRHQHRLHRRLRGSIKLHKKTFNKWKLEHLSMTNSSKRRIFFAYKL